MIKILRLFQLFKKKNPRILSNFQKQQYTIKQQGILEFIYIGK